MAGLDNFFIDRSRKYLIDLIEHLLAHSEAIIFIEGPPGSGRSLLLQYIEQRIPQISRQQPNMAVTIVDDVDELPEYELVRLTKFKNTSALLLAGPPGSCEKIRQSGHFGDCAIERLTIPPFSPDDAKLFLTKFCPPVSPRTRQKLIEQCRLYPGELRQASYDTELVGGNFPSGKLRSWIIYLAIGLTSALLLSRITVHLFPKKTDPEPHITSPEQKSAPVLRSTQVRPKQLQSPAAGTNTGETLTAKKKKVHKVTRPPQLVEHPAPPLFYPTAPVLPQLAADRERLLAADSTYFTLQLMLATELDNIDQLIVRLSPTEPTYRYPKLVNQQQLYCLVYGNFSTYELAGEAIKKLPADLQQLGPWRRQFSAIQQELSANPVPE